MRAARVLVALALLTGCAAASHEMASSAPMYPSKSPCKNYILLGEESDFRNFPGVCMRTQVNLVMLDKSKAAKWRCKNVYKGQWFVQRMLDGKMGVPQCNRVRHGKIGHP